MIGPSLVSALVGFALDFGLYPVKSSHHFFFSLNNVNLRSLKELTSSLVHPPRFTMNTCNS